jgi:hypothetical protein
LTRGSAVSTFEPGSGDNGAWGEKVAFLKFGDVHFVAGVEGTIAGDKTEDKVVTLAFYRCGLT